MPTNNPIKLASSILSADFARLGEQVAEATRAGADYIHIDIMDGRFVPSITWGPGTVEALKSWTHLPLDVHLMIVEPDRQIANFLDAGADILTVQAEACTHLHRVVTQIKEQGARAGVALTPATSATAVEDVLHLLDLLLVMTVNPGFPAQSFIAGSERKVARIRNLLREREVQAELEVDGGISADTAPAVVESGAQVLVAGSAIFRKDMSVAEAVAKLRASVAHL